MRRILHSDGFRYRLAMPIPGLPRRTCDIAFPRQKVAVFVDGCFWHGCPVHASWPVANADWWLDKIQRNQARDLATAQHLHAKGWAVVRVWEHEDPRTAADRIEKLVRGRATAQ